MSTTSMMLQMSLSGTDFIPFFICKHTSFHCALLYTDNCVCVFFKLQVCGNPALSKSIRHFSNICSLLYLCHIFGNSHAISSFFIITIFIMMICDRWSFILQWVLGHHRSCLYMTDVIDRWYVPSDFSGWLAVPPSRSSIQVSLLPETQQYWN